jgi:hypothetical protein
MEEYEERMKRVDEKRKRERERQRWSAKQEKTCLIQKTCFGRTVS